MTGLFLFFHHLRQRRLKPVKRWSKPADATGKKLTGTLHKIEGRQIGVSKAGGEYRVTDLRSGLSLGKHTSQTEALKIAADGIKKIGKTTLDQRTKQILANKNKTWIRGK